MPTCTERKISGAELLVWVAISLLVDAVGFEPCWPFQDLFEDCLRTVRAAYGDEMVGFLIAEVFGLDARLYRPMTLAPKACEVNLHAHCHGASCVYTDLARDKFVRPAPLICERGCAKIGWWDAGAPYRWSTCSAT
jgi:hypothetical protein